MPEKNIIWKISNNIKINDSDYKNFISSIILIFKRIDDNDNNNHLNCVGGKFICFIYRNKMLKIKLFINAKKKLIFLIYLELKKKNTYFDNECKIALLT